MGGFFKNYLINTAIGGVFMMGLVLFAERAPGAPEDSVATIVTTITIGAWFLGWVFRKAFFGTIETSIEAKDEIVTLIDKSKGKRDE